METLQFIDVDVSKAKYELELEQFDLIADNNRRRGIILLDATFPNVHLAFTSIKLNPSPIVFAVRINFDNYDLEPLSITFVNSHTLEPIALKQLIGSQFFRKISNNQQPPQALLQQNTGKLPFLCIPGVREYHNHPGHSGDSWFLYRSNGEGNMGFLIEKLYEYGISAIACYQIPGINIQGGNVNYQIGNMNILSLPIVFNNIPE